MSATTRISTKTRSAACSPYAARRDSELNTRGHEIMEAAQHLLNLLKDLGRSSAEEVLIRRLKSLGVPEYDEFNGSCLGCLGDFVEGCRGFTWAVKIFTDTHQSSLIPTASQLEATNELVAEHQTRRKPR